MIDALFSVPLGIYDGVLTNHLSTIKPACEQVMQQHGSKHPFYCEIESTFNTCSNVHELEPFSTLAYTTTVFAQRFLKEIGGQGTPTIRNAWINIARTGQYQEQHHHIDQKTCFVAVYYVQANEEDKILLVRPYHDLSWIKGKGHYLRPEAEIQCREGRLLFFPPHMIHGFKAIQRSVPKISIAFNFSLE